MAGSLSSWVILLVKTLCLNQCLPVVTGTKLYPHMVFMWRGFGSVYVRVCVRGYVSVSRAQLQPAPKGTYCWLEPSQ